jgi:hypothetical protein
MLQACTLGQQPPGGQACTLIGCGSSLEIALVGEHVPTDFSLRISIAGDDVVSVRCTEGNAEFDPPKAARWSPACPAGGVTFQEFTPTQLTVSLKWAEGETTQEFAPKYAAQQPNGPNCAPVCTTARIELHIPEVPAYGHESSWETYTDEEHGFSIKYPRALQLMPGTPVDGYRLVSVGDKIEIRTNSRDPLVCQGECPRIQNNEPVSLGAREARQVRGYIGSIGGNIPQYFLMYVVRLGDTFASFVLYAESREATSEDVSYIRALKEEDLQLFERMMQTLAFAE